MSDGSRVTYLATPDAVLRAVDLGDQRWIPIVQRVEADRAQVAADLERINTERRAARAKVQTWGRSSAVLMLVSMCLICSPLPMRAGLVSLAIATAVFLRAAMLAVRFLESSQSKPQPTQ